MARRRSKALPSLKGQRDGGDSGAGRLADTTERQVDDDGAPICPLCDRPIPPEARQSLHHLVPILRGGRRGPTVLLHQICHNEIHSALTETELARSYASVEALRRHPQLATFRGWVAAKPPGFHSKTVGNHRRSRKRRR